MRLPRGYAARNDRATDTPRNDTGFLVIASERSERGNLSREKTLPLYEFFTKLFRNTATPAIIYICIGMPTYIEVKT